MAPDRRQIHDNPGRDNRGSEPTRYHVSLRQSVPLRNTHLLQEETEASHHETESHQDETGANPCEHRSLFGEIIPHVSDWLPYDGRFHSCLLKPKNLRGHPQTPRWVADGGSRSCRCSGHASPAGRARWHLWPEPSVCTARASWGPANQTPNGAMHTG